MLLKDYLADTFIYNDTTNKKLLVKIGQLPNREESVRLFSHLIHSQNKWMARLRKDPSANNRSWWEPVYAFQKLDEEWTKSVLAWLKYIDSRTEEDLQTEVVFTGYDGGQWAATPWDIALQLNYHSIHHRAQIQTLIRQQGLAPDFVDYIGTKYRKLT